MTQQTKKSVLIVLRRSPYGSSLASAAIDTALATAAFEQPVDVLLLGDGALHLQAGQDSGTLGIKNKSKLLASLPLYDIERVYVDSEASARYQLDLSKAPLDSKSLDPGAMRELMLRYDHLLGF